MSTPSPLPVLPAARTTSHRRLIAIAGNPNAGKTTLFNVLTGTRQKTGNYAGVTVERKVGQYRLPSGETVDVVDLPGCYSLAARSPEEQIAHDVLLGELEGRRPDKVIVVVDASNLKRNLFLATQLRDLGIPMIIALNMMDIARERGTVVSPEKLSKALGCPAIPLVARRGDGVEELVECLEVVPCDDCTCLGDIPRFIDCLPPALEIPLTTLADGLVQSGLASAEEARGEALWLLISALEGDDAVSVSPARAALTHRVLKDTKLTSRQVRAIETSARYRYLRNLMVVSACEEQDLPHRLTDRLDRVLLHRVWGPVIFFGLMALIFQSIFSWSAPAMDAVEGAINGAVSFVGNLLPEGLFRDLVLNGAISGVGNVLIFLPQIIVLFLFIGLLEDIGYMARAAFIMDRLMARAGLDGRAFLPLLSSFACAIPGIMATRTIASRKDRLVTILVAPLMSCSARLPVYTLIIGTVFIANQPVLAVFSIGGLVLMAMYLLSIVAGVTVAALLKRSLLKSPPPPLLLELPTYKLPSLKTIGLNLLDRGRLFVYRAGTVILAATVILWALMNIPIADYDRGAFDTQRAAISGRADLSEDARGVELAAIDAHEQATVVEHSIGGVVGKFIEPVIAPLGFDWKIGIGIIASFAAREVFVSGLAVVYGVGEDGAEASLRDQLRAERDPMTGAATFTPLVGMSLLVFFVLACQCISTVAIVRRETMTWRWPLFMVAYMSALAYFGSLAVYQGGKLLGLG